MPSTEAGCGFGAIHFMPSTDLLVAVEDCGGGTATPSEAVVLLALDGQATARLATLPATVAVTGFAIDRTGHFLLLATIDRAGDAGSADLLMLRNGEQQPLPHAFPAPDVGGVDPVW